MKLSGDTMHVSLFLFSLENKNISVGKRIHFFVLFISVCILLRYKFGVVTKAILKLNYSFWAKFTKKFNLNSHLFTSHFPF